MRSCGSLSDTRAREIDDVEAVGLFIGSNGDVELAFLRSKHLGTLKVGVMSAKFLPTRHVKENLS